MNDFLKKIYVNKPEKVIVPAQPPADKNEKKRSFPWAIFSLVVLIIFSAAAGFLLAVFSRFLIFETLLTLMPGEKLLAETNILVLGLDQGEQVHRSDTIMVVHIDPIKNEVNVVSIPRDTIASIPGRGPDKISHAYAYGGIALSKATIENFLNIKIPYYMTIDTDSLAKLIDEIGGVTINVEKRMYYIDNSQNLFVDLKPGVQTLNGRNALSYLRFRHDDGDLKRILRQQKFMQALASQFLKKENLIKSPQVVLKMFSSLETNMNTREILGMALNIRKIVEFGQIHMAMIPGSDLMIKGIYYLKPDYETVKKTVDEYFKGTT
ncbi:MAG: LCP family protein [Candidatus Margulisiibacteriota bacterium]